MKQTKPVILYIMFQVPESANGGVNSLIEIILGLTNYTPIVLTQAITPANQKLSKAGVEVVIAPKEKTGSGALKKFLFSNWLHTFLKGRNIALVHVNDIQAYLHVFIAVKLHRLPLVFNVRGILSPDKAYKKHWYLLRFCDKIITLSKEMRASLLERLPLPAPNRTDRFITYIYSIVNFDKFYPVEKSEKKLLRAKLGITTDHTLIGFVAKFDPIKQQLEFIENVLPELDHGQEVLFIGDFSPSTKDYDYQCQLALEKRVLAAEYRIVGYIDSVEEYYKALDMIVVPSEREGMARCMIEGLACGLPVVSFDVNSAHEILDDPPCGIVSYQGDYASIVDAINKISNDVIFYKELSENGKNKAKKLFRKEVAIAKYEAIYNELIHETT